MPKRTDLQSILIIGSGPIIIGQACEFDYSGTQACRALRGEGYRVVLVNSNPATIMTDPEFADATYIEPLDRDTIAAIIAQEKPDVIVHLAQLRSPSRQASNSPGSSPAMRTCRAGNLCVVQRRQSDIL